MSFIRRRVTKNSLFIFLVLALLAWPVIGQESVLEQILPRSPLFSIVAPLELDVVSGDVVFIIKPLSTLTSSTLRLVSPPADFVSDFSPDNSFMVTWSSTLVPNGDYRFDIEACADSTCETKSVSVRVNNPVLEETPSSSTLNDDSSLPVDSVSPGSLDDVPSSRDSSPSRIRVTPSNYFGLFSIQGSSFSDRSSGDDFSLLPGDYTADARFLDDGLSLALSSVSLDSRNILFFLEKNSVSEFSSSGISYDVTSSLAVSIPYSFDVGTLLFVHDPSPVIAACVDWSVGTQSCLSEWVVSTADDISLDFTSSSVLLARATQRPAVAPSDSSLDSEIIPTLPADVPTTPVPDVEPPVDVPADVVPVSDPVVPSTPPVDIPAADVPVSPPLGGVVTFPVEDPLVDIGPIPLPASSYTIFASNLSSSFTAASLVSDAVVLPSYSQYAILPQGKYDFSISFDSSDVLSAVLNSVTIDQNATLIHVSPYSSFTIPSLDVNSSVSHAWLVHFSLPFSSASFSLSNALSEQVYLCPSWDVSSSACSLSWEKVDSSNAFALTSYSPDSLIAFVHSPASSADLPVLPDDLLQSAENARLIHAIWALKNTHSNKRYFIADASRRKLSPLSALFSSIEVALQCAPSSTPSNTLPSPPLVDVTPIPGETIPIPIPDDSIPPAVLPDLPPVIPSSDTNSSLASIPSSLRASFQSDESSTLVTSTPVALPSIDPLPAPDAIPVDVPADNSFFNPRSPLFYSNAWEDTLSDSSFARGGEDLIDCDGVSLLNTFDDLSNPPSSEKDVYLGSTLGRVKQSMYVTNTTSLPQDRVIIVRHTSPFSLVSSGNGPIRPSAKYELVPSRLDTSTYVDSSDENFSPIVTATPVNSVLRLQNDTGTVSGLYDFSDFVSSGYSPDVLVHSRNNETVIETVLRVHVLPGQTIYLDPLYDLGDPATFSSMFYGGVIRDYLGKTSSLTTFLRDQRSPGVILSDMDGNGYANDLLIVSMHADVNTKADAGAVYLIMDVDTKTGTRDLNQSQYYNVRWNGAAASVQLANPNTAGQGVRVVNLDGNTYANDIVIVSPLSDGAATDAGIIYMFLDAYRSFTGNEDLADTRNYTAMWNGATASDRIGDTGSSGDGLQILDIDGNGVPNDMIFQATLYNGSGRTDNGAIFIVKDMNRYRGNQLLSSTASYASAFHGSMASDSLGTLVGTSSGVYVVNVDGNTYANDLIIGAGVGDAGRPANNVGEIYLILDADLDTGVVDLNTTANYNARWYAQVASDGLGAANANTTAVGQTIFVVNADGNYSANDLVISCPFCDAGGTNRGAVYYIADINRRSGDYNLSAAASYNVRWVGATNTDEIGLTNGSGDGLIVADMDGNGVANDLIVNSYLHNSIAPATARTDNGAVYFIRDFNKLSGNITLNNTTTSYSAVWYGSVASDFLGDMNFSGTGVQLVNLDGNLVANDLIIGGHRINSITVDSGAVYLIEDINTRAGNFDLNTASNFAARWGGGATTDGLGKTNDSGPGVQIVNVDGNTYANDLLLTAVMADVNAKTDAGAVYLIENIHTKSGLYNLASTTGYNIAWIGGMAGDKLGDNNRSAVSVAVENFDNNSYSNDLFISASRADRNFADGGALYLFLDIDKIPDGNYDLNNTNSYYRAYYGATLNDQLASSADSNTSFDAVDIDGNGYTNDIWVMSAFADINGRTEVGALYLIRDIVVVPSAPVSPDVNVWRIDGYPDNADFPLFNYYFDGNLTLDFNVYDLDTNSLLLDVNYSSSSTPYTGTVIVDDVNLSTLPSSGAWNCADTAFTNVTRCSIDWNVLSVADGNYFIHATVRDSSALVDQNTSDRNVGIANTLGSLSLGITTPSSDNTSYNASQVFDVNGTTSCTLFRCGAVDTYLQYCVGTGCTDFYDMNTTDGSPLEIVYGSVPDSNADLNATKSYFVDWGVIGNVAGTYELRLRAIGTAASASTTNGTGQTITIASLVPPDVNVWRFDRSPDNGPFKVFNYYGDGNLSIDFNVFDSDTNSLLLDINYSVSPSPYTGTIIYNDLNLSTLPFGTANQGGLNCADTDFTNVTRCTVDWNIVSVPDGNYWIHATLTDSSGLVDQNTSDRNVGIRNRAPPAVAIIKIDGYVDTSPVKVFDYYLDGNLTIDFNVMDIDTNGLLIDINYSASATPYTGTPIVDDVNLAKLLSSGAWYCQDTDFTNVTTCGIDWNALSVADGNYFIHITATDESSTVDENISDVNIGISNRGPFDVNGFITVYSERLSDDYVISDIDVNYAVLTIPAGRFIQDHNYLIFTSALLTGSANNVQVHSNVTHRGVPFQTVEETQELPAAADSTFNYSSIVLWQAVSGESISYEVTGLIAATSVTVRNASMIIIDLNKLTRNTDWFYDLNETDIVNASSTFASNPSAAITFTPDGISDYLFLGTGQMQIDGTVTNFAQMELHDGASQLALAQRDFEDATDQSVLSVMEVVDNPPASPSTYRLRFSGNSQHDLNSSALFILRMDALATHDSNIVDENFLITPTLATRADLNIPLGKDGNVVAFYATAARHERGTVGNTQYTYQAHFDDVNYFSAEGNFMRSWSTSAEAYGGDLSFNLTGLDFNVPDDLNHKYSTKLISETSDPLVDAHAERKAGVVIFTHRLSGDLNILWDYPATDGVSYGTGVLFSASGRTLCEDYNCGLVGTRLQYCAGAACTDFYDINSVSGSPLELVTGSIPDTNSDLNVTQWYDANWTLKGNVAGTYELRLYASGDTSETNYTPSGQRTVTITSADYTFVLSLPSSGCTNGKGNITGGTSCQRGWLESTDTTGASDANQIAPEGQTSSISFFSYDNQSSSASDLNIILDLNAALSSQLRLKASTVSSGYQSGCTGNPSVGCILLTTSTQNVGKATYTTGTQDLNVWFWADFVAASIQQTDINVDSNSVSP